MSGERIETAGELDALPMGSVVVDRHGDTWMLDRHGWLSPETAGFVGATLVRKWAPLTVVYRPDRDLIAEAEARGAREADAALTKALGQRDAVAVTAERMTSYARQAEAVLREIAALADDMSDELDMLRAEPGPVALSYANCTAMDLRRIRAILARAEQTGGDR